MKIYVTNEYTKNRILEECAKNKCFNDGKFFSFSELKKKRFFDYDNKTLEYIMKKYNVNINIAKIYVENLYFLSNIDNDKINFLNELKKDLDENKLLIYNDTFRDYILKQNIFVVGIKELSLEEEKILDGLNYEIKKSESNNFLSKLYSAKDINEEVEFVVRYIKKMIHEGININNIKIVASDNYNKYLEYFFDMFKVPINLGSMNMFYGTGIASLFLEMYDNYEINEIIDKLSGEKNINDLVTIINKSVLVDDKNIRKEFIINDFKKTKIRGKEYKDAVKVCDIHECFSDEDYVFLLGFNIGSYPYVKKDDDYLSDSLKEMLGLDTSILKNRREKENIILTIKNIRNLVITYNLHDGNKVMYPSILIDELGIDAEDIKIDRKISYSKKYSEICYAMDLDRLYKYNDASKDLKFYQSNLNIPYREYNNKYFKVNKDMLKESLENGLTLSYTSLEMYNECSFKYFISKIMNLDIFEETFKTIIGKIVHHILEIGLTKNIDIENEICEFIKDMDFCFGPRELFYIHKLSKELEFLLNYLKEQEKHSKLNNYLFEKEINIEKEYDGINVLFKGFIDKVMLGKYNDKDVIAVVDYKTGDKNIKLDTLEYGLNIQLPIYLYLLRNSEEFKDSIIAGFYIERVLNNVFNIDKSKSIETLKSENLRLQGYTNSNETIISLLDNNYLDSKMIKGLRFKSDGSFYSTSKVLSNDEMDKLIITVDKIINDAIKNIIDGEFNINPKVIKGKNIACTYCKFKDICFKTKEDEVVLEEQFDQLNDVK